MTAVTYWISDQFSPRAPVHGKPHLRRVWHDFLGRGFLCFIRTSYAEQLGPLDFKLHDEFIVGGGSTALIAQHDAEARMARLRRRRE